MVWRKRIKKGINGNAKGSLSRAYYGRYRNYSNDRQKLERKIDSFDVNEIEVVSSNSLLDSSKGITEFKKDNLSSKEIEKDKLSAPSMLGDPGFFKEVAGLEIKISPKTPAPGA